MGSDSPAIGLLGDVMLGRGVGERIAAQGMQGLWSADLLELTNSCDLVVANLECCLSARGAPTDAVAEKPFFFRGPPEGVAAVAALGHAVVAGLANNHALDYGPEALLDTRKHLDGAGVRAVGAAAEVEAAREGAIVEAGGSSVAVLAFSDHPREFAAGEDSPGIAHADLARGLPDWLATAVASFAERADLLVAFPHWGPNMTTEPAAGQRRVAEELLGAGADLVAGHSAHTFHGVGWAGERPMLFDLGDALDDYRVDPLLRNDLGLLAIWRPGAGSRQLELVGLALDYCRTSLARGEAAEWIAARLVSACKPLGTAVERTAEQRFSISPR